MGSLPFLTGLLGVSGFYYATNILSNNLAFFIEIFSYFSVVCYIFDISEIRKWKKD